MKATVKFLLTICLAAVFSIPSLAGNAFSYEEPRESNGLLLQTFEVTSDDIAPDENLQGLMSSIPDYIKTPAGGIPWNLFATTKENPYSYKDDEGLEWSGVRPEFAESLKKLNGKEILMQGYMFPLDQTEKQSQFLLGPFPISCPYHYHVTPNLIIEAHAKAPVDFSYDAINIKGKLELVPKDNENNVFYRLKDAVIVK